MLFFQLSDGKLSLNAFKNMLSIENEVVKSKFMTTVPNVVRQGFR